MALVFDHSGVVQKENEFKHLEREEKKYKKEVDALLHIHGLQKNRLDELTGHTDYKDKGHKVSSMLRVIKEEIRNT